VAQTAVDGFMRSLQRECALPVVVEDQDVPVDQTVAPFTRGRAEVCSELSHVDIVVACETLRSRARERYRGVSCTCGLVALLAGGRPVGPPEREIGVFVVEAARRNPRIRAVAGGTGSGGESETPSRFGLHPVWIGVTRTARRIRKAELNGRSGFSRACFCRP